jgi:hypothetical protein
VQGDVCQSDAYKNWMEGLAKISQTAKIRPILAGLYKQGVSDEGQEMYKQHLPMDLIS